MEFINYTLPVDRIAAWPAAQRLGARDSARLLRARQRGAITDISDRRVRDLPEILQQGDLVVLNSSRVVPYRFFGSLADSGGEIEILLLNPLGPSDRDEIRFRALANPMRKLRPGRVVILSSALECVSQDRDPGGDQIVVTVRRRSECARDDAATPVSELLMSQGIMPIPPYIRQGRGEAVDRELYQTVYADKPGSVAAPTAGLHFTPEVLARLGVANIQVCFLTLHVGAMSIISPREGVVGSEYYQIPEETLESIARIKKQGGRIVAVGTTTTRALESYALANQESQGYSSLFITDGFSFQMVDVMMTNFHQPQSTHLHMVSAFFGGDRLRRVYDHALTEDYLFLSYGDAMLLERE